MADSRPSVHDKKQKNRIPSKQDTDQKETICNLLKTSLKKGDTWYLITTTWYNKWKKYVGYDCKGTSFKWEKSAHPRCIDNAPLFKEGSIGVLKENLVDGQEYVLVPKEALKKWIEWYGIVDKQYIAPRKVIEQGMFEKKCKVEVYLMDLKLCPYDKQADIMTCQFSRTDTLEDIEKEMRRLYQIDDKKQVRLWCKYTSNTYEQLCNLEDTVQDAGLYQNQVIVIEEQKRNGTWPRKGKTRPSESDTGQKEIIGNLLKTPLMKDDTWYLITTTWYNRWKKYVGYDFKETSFKWEKSAHPGPIDNASLFKEGSIGVLKENLVDGREYVLVPKKAWHNLLAWYDIGDRQHEAPRKVIVQVKVEVYLMDLMLCTNHKQAATRTLQFSRVDTIDDIEKEMRRLFKIDDKRQVRLWCNRSYMYEELCEPKDTVQDAGLYQNQVIVIEEQNADGTWPRGGKKSNPEDFSCGPPTTPGLCGLSNLGNTCFMNSAIQCMSNVPELTEYFSTGKWKKDLNKENPIGMRGNIATSYAKLIANMWSGENSYTVPRNFKAAVGAYAPQFSGYQQQDSQELMLFLLDGLHEDLNRIKQKPYIEKMMENGEADALMATEAWGNYLKRNNSIIVDIFHGQLKSSLVCLDCKNICRTFDPICFLSLPLPDKKERHIKVFFVPNDPLEKAKHYKLTVPQRGNVNHLSQALIKVIERRSRCLETSSLKMFVTDVYRQRFHKIFSPEDPLTDILDTNDIFIYEVTDDMETLVLPVYMREKARSSSSSYNRYQLFGLPLLVPVPKQHCTYDMLYKCVLRKVNRFMKVREWLNYCKMNGLDDLSEQIDCVDKSNNKKKATPKRTTSGSMGASSTRGNNSTGNGMRKKRDGNRPAVEPSASASSGSMIASGRKNTNDEKEMNEDDSGYMDKAGNQRPTRLFALQLIDSFGTIEIGKLPDDGRALELSSDSYIAIKWNPSIKSQFYHEQAVMEMEEGKFMNLGNEGPDKKQTVQLSECLDLFITKEKLREQDPMYCPNCKKHQRATKKFDLWQLPPVLIIHLKRFSYKGSWRNKLDTFVEYPTKGLDMRKWVINQNHGPAKYDLVAVSNHYGSIGGGHYTAYGKNEEDGLWHYFDDSSVSTKQEESAVTKAGYVLVYRRQDAPPLNYSLPSSSATTPASTTTTPLQQHQQLQKQSVHTQYGLHGV